MIGAVAVVIVLNKDEKKSKGITISDSKVFSEEIKEIVVVVNDNIINKLNDYSFNRINKEIGVNYVFENMFVYDSVRKCSL